jgi:hypothetical protein
VEVFREAHGNAGGEAAASPLVLEHRPERLREAPAEDEERDWLERAIRARARRRSLEVGEAHGERGLVGILDRREAECARDVLPPRGLQALLCELLLVRPGGDEEPGLEERSQERAEAALAARRKEVSTNPLVDRVPQRARFPEELE